MLLLFLLLGLVKAAVDTPQHPTATVTF